MTVKDLIWKLEQIYDKNKDVSFGTDLNDEIYIHNIKETEFRIRLEN